MTPEELATLKSSKAVVEARKITIPVDLDMGIAESQPAVECYVKSVIDGGGTTERSAIVVSAALDQPTLMGVKKGLLGKREIAKNTLPNSPRGISMSQFNRDDVECVGLWMPLTVGAERSPSAAAVQYSACRGLRANRIIFVSTVDQNLLGSAVIPVSTLYQFDRVVGRGDEDFR